MNRPQKYIKYEHPYPPEMILEQLERDLKRLNNPDSSLRKIDPFYDEDNRIMIMVVEAQIELLKELFGE